MLKKLWRWLVAKWWLVYFVAMFATVVSIFVIRVIPPYPSYSAQTINYSLVYQRGSYLNGLLVTIFCPGLLFLVGVIFSYRKIVWTILLAPVTFFLYVFFLALISPAVARILPDPDRPVLSSVADREDPQGRHYALASYTPAFRPSTLGGYNLYACDNFPFECDLIYTHWLNEQDADRIMKENDPALQPRLETDESGVKFFLGDELLYSEP